MAELSKLRRKASETKELQEKKLSRIKAAVSDVINSSAFPLSVLAHSNETDTDEGKQEFAEKVAERVTEVVLDKRLDFIDTLKSRGMDDIAIKHAVLSFYKIMCKGDETKDYDEKLRTVSEYLERNPFLYEDFGLFS